ncbi:hypothetical protein V5O48_018864, partial [Marasmius crinis-equi]
KQFSTWINFKISVQQLTTDYVLSGLQRERLCSCLSRLLEPPSALDIGLFVLSSHPLVLELFPHVQGWDFREGEMVESWDGNQQGRVGAMDEAGMEIITVLSLGSLIEEHQSLDLNVNKCWNLGDYVKHPTGRKGLVVGFDDYLVWSDFLVHEHILNIFPPTPSLPAGYKYRHT